MPGVPDLSNYVTHPQLDGRLQPLAEIRTMLREDLRGLHEGQAGLSRQLQEMGASICDRMDEANHRTTKLEKKLDATEIEVQEARDTAKTVLNEGCRQKMNHVQAITTLARVGALDEWPVSPTTEPQPFLQKHGRKAAVASGIGLGGFGLGVLAPHVGPFLDWVLHLFLKAPK